MAVYKLVHFSSLSHTKRMDAEYYSPRFEPVLRKLGLLNTVKLKHILVEPVKTGHTPSMKNSSYYKPKAVKFIKTDNLREDIINTHDIQYLSEIGNSKISRSELRIDDVILTIIGATEDIIGRAARVFSNLGRANINQNIALIRSRLPAGYLVTFLNSYYGREQLIRLSRQTGQVNLNCREVEELSVPLFTDKFIFTVHNLNNQRHNLILQSEQMYAKAEQILLSELGLHSWKPRHTLTYVRSFSQVAKASRMDAEHFQPKYKEMFDRLPSNVYLQLLGKITLYTKGIEVGSSAYTESGIPFLRVSNLSKHGIVDDTVNFISNELYNVLREKYEPQQGEILLSKDATPGIAYFLDESVQGIIASGILRLSLIEDIPPYYLELVLNSIFVQLQIEQSVGGSIIKHWKPSQVQKTWIPRLLADREKEISALVQQSHAARREAKTLLEKAKRAVEIAIEYGEQQAMDFLCK